MRNTPAMKVTVHHKRHSTLIIAISMVAVLLDVITVEMVMDNIAPSIVVRKAVVLSKSRMVPTTVHPMSVCILDVTMPKTVIKCTVIYMMIKGVKNNDLQ